MNALFPMILLADGGVFFIAFAVGITHARRRPGEGETQPPGSLGGPAHALVIAATAVAAFVLVYRGMRAGSFSLPLSDHLDAFCLLAVLLAGGAAYFRMTRRFRSLTLFLLPMIGALLLLGGLLAAIAPAPYNYSNIWTLLHVIAVIAGTLCLAMGCVGGGVYLLAHRQLKPAGVAAPHPVRGLPPLATIERFNLLTVYVGFPLLTVAMITGFLRFAQGSPGSGTDISRAGPKILLAVAAWIIYALVAYAPLTPRLRGVHVAWLSIVGFSLVLATYAAVTWM